MAMLASCPPITVEDAIRTLKTRPEYESLMHDIYVDDDVVPAALRFARSEEFRCVATWAASLGITPPARVLDLGAGRGIASLAWALRGYEVTALEPDPSDLVGNGAIRHLVQRTGVPVAIEEQVGEHTTLQDKSFDLVYVRQVLHHATDLRQMCREISRVLKPGGFLVATREHVVSNNQQLESFWENHPVHQLAGGEMAFTLAQYLTALRLAGFKKISIYGPWDTPVNYFPASAQSVAEASKATAVRWLGESVGQHVARLPYYQRWWSRRRSRREASPGRMYSFVATCRG
jgi:ubiquinone/menaquinone biosynthesis C-methylase UbiE